MQGQLGHYLQRARIAAQRDSVIYRTPVTPLLERMVRVMAKLGRGTSLSFAAPAEEIVFAGEREDLEEVVGNLLENAMKWAKRRVVVSLTTEAAADGHSMFSIAIEDDGPGIPEDKARDALKRGKRLDESKPGTGLGLAIVSDLVSEYGGRIELGRSELGGLKAVVLLRSVE
jgi:signal transduction histidine kinase